MRVIRVGQRGIGPQQPCFLAAEVGVNHNGSAELAHRLIDAAADAGADAVKFQNFRTEEFISDRSLTYEYRSQGQTVVESQYDMFKRLELPRGVLCELREHCDRRGLAFFSTPSGQSGIEELVQVGAGLLKNGSDYLGHLPMIRAMAGTGLPTVLSTGMATLGEIDEAVRAFREASGKDLMLLHCTSCYPPPASEVHLRKIPVLAAAFDCPVGFSDHTEGIVAAVGSVALGSCFIEKHFTLDKHLPGPDHWFSSDPGELRALASAIRALEKNLGSAEIGPAEAEAEGRLEYKLSCVAARDLAAGHKLSDADIAFRRPGRGVPPAAVVWLVGRRLKAGVKNGRVFQPEDFD
jgi:N,N'-diacetyllegionaminate synthase